MVERSREELREWGKMFESWKREELRWVLEDDVEVKEEWLDGEKTQWDTPKLRRTEIEVIRFLVERLCVTKLASKDWKLRRIVKQSGLEFTEGQVLRIVKELGAKGCWKQALSVVEWVYDDKERRLHKSRFVYTRLLAVLGKARRPEEALNVFNIMCVMGDCYIYLDMAAYHSIAITLGQAGRLRELLKIMECVRQKPSKRTENMHFKNWNPVLEPDIVVYNAVMLQSGKYDFVHEYFRKMMKSGETPKALTYKVLVRAFSGEGKVNEAVEIVRDMEQKGVVGASSMFYELACCLCSNGRWEDAMLEGGHINDCISIFEHMKSHCSPNIGTLNIMLKVYGRNDMFSKAKELFEDIKKGNSDSCPLLDGHHTFLILDEYTYNSMLEASASAFQWEYFEYVYKEMVLSGYQLDQNTHASILWEASKAGKWHLLEHAFDAILEAGEIPNSLYFTEMVLQATAREDYGRAVTLINTMALAPFQVSEEQWKDLFEKNRDRISQDNLERIMCSLDNCDITSESTVVNLSRALRCLYESGASRDISTSTTFGSKLKEELSLFGYEEISFSTKIIMPQHSKEWADNIANSDEDPCHDSIDVSCSASSVIQANSGTDIICTEMVSGSLNNGCHEDVDTNLPTSGFGSAKNEVGDDLSGPLHSKLSRFSLIENNEDVDEVELEALLDGFNDSDESNLPSAYEVLEAWKESRKKDGMFSFQLGQK